MNLNRYTTGNTIPGGNVQRYFRLAVLALVAGLMIPAVVSHARIQDDENQLAWEYRPYQVLVWLCSDGTPEIEANRDRLCTEISRRSQLIDANAWNLDCRSPDRPTQWTMLNSIIAPEGLTESLAAREELNGFDKLICICVNGEGGNFRTRVRELDMDTRQWGPTVSRSHAALSGLGSGLTHSIRNAFMPIAEVQRVTEIKNEKGRPVDKVFLRSRAIRTCRRARPWLNAAEIPGDGEDNDGNGLVDDYFGWDVETTESSPVFVNPSDRFLPIIRETNRDGSLKVLKPIAFTYLTIDELDQANAVCSIQSSHNAPLSGRRKKRLRKLALVIRPPEAPTTLKLVARDEEATPLEGYTVISSHPGAVLGELEELGQTDWRGQIVIPPGERGLRLLLVKHGDRKLLKLPVIPGLYSDLQMAVPDDETRLYAEGIIAGLSTDILNLVTQRNVYEAEIDELIKADKREEAEDLLDKYRELPRVKDIKNRLSDERTALRIRSTERRESEFIDTMFNALLSVVNSKMVNSNETTLQRRIQDPNFVPETKTDEFRDDAELQKVEERALTPSEAREMEEAKAREQDSGSNDP